MILYETTTSVIELLWDIALAVFIIQIALIYYLGVFLCSCLVNFIRSSKALHPLYAIFQFTPTTHQLDIAEITAISFLTIMWARFINVKFQIPRHPGFRLVIGVLALTFMMGSDLVLGVLAYEEGWDAWRFDRPRGVMGAVMGLLGLFAFMPALWLALEGKEEWRGEKVHGHDGKGVVAAVPTVSVTERKHGEKKVH